MVQPDRPQTTI